MDLHNIISPQSCGIARRHRLEARLWPCSWLRVALVSAAVLSLASCFKDEAANSECDIEQAYIHCDEPETMFYNVGDTLITVLSTEDYIDFKVRRGTDRSALAPLFRITAGAVISPESGSEHDFSQGAVTYTVTSEDGCYSRQYRVSVSEQTYTTSDTLFYDFECYYLESSNEQYYVWSDLLDDGSYANNWASGNAGFAVSKSSAAPDEYPTVPLIDGYDGAAVKLVTRDTGAFGVLKNMRLAAGNLFIGRFDVSQALLTDGALKATMFGMPYTKDARPVSFEGYYTYAPGPTYQDVDGNTVSGETDRGDIYAVLYRNTDADGNAVMLNGADILTSEYIVAIAQVDDVSTTAGWTRFDEAFDYLEDLDESLLAGYGYNLTVVFTSSMAGASFEGAIDSELHIDKVRIICEATE